MGGLNKVGSIFYLRREIIKDLKNIYRYLVINRLYNLELLFKFSHANGIFKNISFY